jgi:hypothetical protein
MATTKKPTPTKATPAKATSAPPDPSQVTLNKNALPTTSTNPVVASAQNALNNLAPLPSLADINAAVNAASNDNSSTGYLAQAFATNNEELLASGQQPLTVAEFNGTTGTLPDNTSTGVNVPVTDPIAAMLAQENQATIDDAFKLLEAEFTSYGLSSLIPTIEGYMKSNMGPNEATLLLEQSPAYQQRFSGNTTRQAAGLNVLSPADYIAMENSYSTLLTQYGQQNLATQSQFAQLIGNDVSAAELNKRLDLAVTQVQQVDPSVKQTLQQYYPSITNQNLVSYFLNPTETLPQLQLQVGTAQVGAAAVQQGLSDTQARAQQLAQLGVSYNQAQTGYGKIAEVLPAASKLSTIYGQPYGINYDQTTAENQYLLNSGAATLEQQKLTQLEQAQFAGRSGVVGADTTGYSGSLGKSIQGKF